ncbi:hypothetical protein [Microbulbifer discodermiae]|uniref:hypothetical protein n=1 Tax=Microbulbifer sp. 2201CG32-9 TaxID=3232309 RepID=UPI00345B5B47
MFSIHPKGIFFATAFAIVATNLIAASSWYRESTGIFLETAVIVDFCLTIPLLYILCFRHDLKRALVKAIALACLGFWGATLLIPETQQTLIREFGFLRYLGLGVLVLIEIKVAVLIWKALRNHQPPEKVAEKLTTATDMPPWVARLMAWEVTLWQKLGRAIGFGKKDKS